MSIISYWNISLVNVKMPHIPLKTEHTHHGTCTPQWQRVRQQNSACYNTTTTTQELPKEYDQEIQVSIWTKNSPDPNMIEHPWHVPEILWTIEVPPCNSQYSKHLPPTPDARHHWTTGTHQNGHVTVSQKITQWNFYGSHGAMGVVLGLQGGLGKIVCVK